jgi:hypothetical protein
MTLGTAANPGIPNAGSRRFDQELMIRQIESR